MIIAFKPYLGTLVEVLSPKLQMTQNHSLLRI
jgi:hypothetical protein